MTESKRIPKSVLFSALYSDGGHPFDEIYDVVMGVYGPREIHAAVPLVQTSALVIWGGQDISPVIYGQKANEYTGAPDHLGERDKLEVALANAAIQEGIPIIGICRGAQLMCAMSGGSLVQHVDNHAGPDHPILTKDGARYKCPSLHHQMMHPWPLEEGVDFEKIAWMEEPRSKRYLGEPNEEGVAQALTVPYEPEILWFPQTKALCIQSHPEFISNVQHPFVQYCLALVKEYCGV